MINSSRATRSRVDATTPGRSLSGSTGSPAPDGEEIRQVGSSYTAVLNERSNKSLNRNAGPSRPSANRGMIPTVSSAVRKTGRI